MADSHLGPAHATSTWTIVRRVLLRLPAYVVTYALVRELRAADVAPVVAYQLFVITALLDGTLWWSSLRPANPTTPPPWEQVG
jgi:hypothetical protein